MQSPEAKALVQEVARMAVENHKKEYERFLDDFTVIIEFDLDWWQEFTKEKE